MAKKSIYPPGYSSESRQRQGAQLRRVLYIITKSVWGGAAKYVYDLATHLPKDEFEALVAAGGREKFAQEIIQAKIPYFRISNFQRTINPFKDFFAFFEILSLLFQLKPAVIHVNSSKAGGLVGLASWLYKITKLTTYEVVNSSLNDFVSRYRSRPRLIFTAHGWAFNEDRPNWQIGLIKFFSKLTALFYDKIICVSQYDRQIALENKIAPENKLVTIHNGIDLKVISFLSRQAAQKKLLGRNSSATGRLVIGTIAEWTKNKGLVYLLEAVQNLGVKLPLGASLPNFALVLIGSGENPDKEKIYDFIKNHQLKNIYLHEWIDQAASYLKAFDIFVLPSIKEGLPYTILEAMAAQVPIVASRVGGIPEMVNHDSLVQPKDSQQLAEKILFLINNPEITQKITQQALQKVKREFSLEKMIEGTKKIY